MLESIPFESEQTYNFLVSSFCSSNGRSHKRTSSSAHDHHINSLRVSVRDWGQGDWTVCRKISIQSLFVLFFYIKRREIETDRHTCWYFGESNSKVSYVEEVKLSIKGWRGIWMWSLYCMYFVGRVESWSIWFNSYFMGPFSSISYVDVRRVPLLVSWLASQHNTNIVMKKRANHGIEFGRKVGISL